MEWDYYLDLPSLTEIQCDNKESKTFQYMGHVILEGMVGLDRIGLD